MRTGRAGRADEDRSGAAAGGGERCRQLLGLPAADPAGPAEGAGDAAAAARERPGLRGPGAARGGARAGGARTVPGGRVRGGGPHRGGRPSRGNRGRDPRRGWGDLPGDADRGRGCNSAAWTAGLPGAGGSAGGSGRGAAAGRAALRGGRQAGQDGEGPGRSADRVLLAAAGRTAGHRAALDAPGARQRGFLRVQGEGLRRVRAADPAADGRGPRRGAAGRACTPSRSSTARSAGGASCAPDGDGRTTTSPWSRG